MGEVPDEVTVEVDKAEERLYLLHLLGDWPVGDSLHLHRVHGHFVLGDDKSQVFDFLALELALLCFQEQVVPSQEFKYSAHGLTMFREGLIEGKDVIHEADGAPLVDEVLEDVVHHGLECCWGVAEAKEHDEWFIQSAIRLEGCLVFVSLFDANIVETPLQVELSEVISSPQLVQNVQNEGQW